VTESPVVFMEVSLIIPALVRARGFIDTYLREHRRSLRLNLMHRNLKKNWSCPVSA